MPRFLSLLALLGLVGCADATTPTTEPEDEVFPYLDTLEAWLSGSFSSERQSIESPSYFDIRLEVCAVDAPELGERVLYVEQAVAGSTPYRQRLYVLELVDEDAGEVRTDVYTLTDEPRAIGLCGGNEIRSFRAADASLRDGCGVELTYDEDSEEFVGGTVGENCLSTLQGATYATSEVTLFADGMHSWDRGYDDSGSQVWGAVDGAYEFDRLD